MKIDSIPGTASGPVHTEPVTPRHGIELFAGPGGMSEGIRLAHPDLQMVGVEWDEAACATATAAGHTRIQGDVRKVRLDVLGLFNCEYLHASPPCQGFTLSGRGKGRQDGDLLIVTILSLAAPEWLGAVLPDSSSVQEAMEGFDMVANDHRSVLTLEPLWWIAEAGPEYITLEQVPTVQPIWDAYAVVLRSWGYSVWTGKLRSEQYGTPQVRERAVLMARRGDHDIQPPAPTHSRFHRHDKTKLDPGVLPWVTMAEALGWGMTQRPALTVVTGTGSGGTDPACVGGSGARRVLYGERDAGRWKEPEVAVPGDTSWVYDRPSPAMVASFAADVVAAPGYRRKGDPPRQKTPGSVRVTAAEAGVLQGFPEDYPWSGAKGKQHEQVGNAVPVPMASAIVKALIP